MSNNTLSTNAEHDPLFRIFTQDENLERTSRPHYAPPKANNDATRATPTDTPKAMPLPQLDGPSNRGPNPTSSRFFHTQTSAPRHIPGLSHSITKAHQRGSSRPSSSTPNPHHHRPNMAPRQTFTNLYHPPANPSTNPQSPNTTTPSSATIEEALGLLPWVTTPMRLSNEQAIALSDIGGTLKEVMLVALASAIDADARAEIESAVGPDAAAAIIEFFGQEYTVD